VEYVVSEKVVPCSTPGVTNNPIRICKRDRVPKSAPDKFTITCRLDYLFWHRLWPFYSPDLI